MSLSSSPVVLRMEALARKWDAGSDRRAIFLNCYLMMTRNMFRSIEEKRFHDGAWVEQLLHDFAVYYFRALEIYDADPPSAPAVWRLAHDAARNRHVRVLQNLFLGVNAHINYDLVATLADLLSPAWKDMSEGGRRERHEDYCTVNGVIARTIDAVQDEVVGKAAPSMEIVDAVMGRLDEWMIERLITHWRDLVWGHAVAILDSGDEAVRKGMLRVVEIETLERGHAILLDQGLGSLRNMM